MFRQQNSHCWAIAIVIHLGTIVVCHTHTHTHTHTHIAPIQPPQLQYDAGSSGRSEPLCYPQALSNLEQDRQGFEGGRELVEEGGREERVGKDDGKTVGSEGGEGKEGDTGTCFVWSLATF